MSAPPPNDIPPPVQPAVTARPGPDRRGRLLRLAGVILVVVLAIGAALLLARNLSAVQAAMATAGPWGPLAAVALLVLLSLTPVPAEPFILAFAALFPPLTVVLVASAGNFAATLVEYGLARSLMDRQQYAALLARLPPAMARFPVSSHLFMILGRLIPGVGPKTVSILCGLARVGLPRFAWTGLLTSALGGVVIGLAGTGLVSLVS